jgi:AAA domain
LVLPKSSWLVENPAQAVREFNTMNCGRESNVIYFDLRDVNSEILASGSIYNECSCAFAMTIIEGLILAGVPGSKVILTPYQGQYRILMSALQIMTKTHPEAEEVDVDKIDRCQGSEWDICVIDITRTSGATQGPVRVARLSKAHTCEMYIL